MMKPVTIVAAMLGLAVALWAVVASSTSPPIVEPNDAPPANPFKNGIASTGAIEAMSRNIRVAAPEPDLIAKVFVQVNDAVKAGDSLFQLDARIAEADLAKALTEVQVSQQELARLRAMPRPEDLAKLQASLEQANARYEHARREKERAQRIHTRGALSEQEFSESSLALDEAVATRSQARAELDRAGAAPGSTTF